MKNQSALPAQSRPDLVTAHIVETGIALRLTHGAAYAAAYLSENGVNFSVIVRVLSEPGRRRGVA